MKVPLRLEILRRLTAALEEITVANGYQHDLAGRVYRGRSIFGESDPLPVISILEVPIQPDPNASATDGATNDGSWELVIQGFVEDDKDNPTDPAHFLMADVKMRLGEICKQNQDFNILGPWDGASPVTDLRVGQGVVRPPDEVSYTAYFWLTATLQVVDDLTAPYYM